MSQRTFTDSAGSAWRAFDVRPDNPDRRAGSDRRGAGAPEPVIERRGDDRRVREREFDTGSRHAFRPGFERGWLCFECGELRRRLAPIPPDWERCSDAELEQYLQQASRGTTPRIA